MKELVLERRKLYANFNSSNYLIDELTLIIKKIKRNKTESQLQAVKKAQFMLILKINLTQLISVSLGSTGT